MGKRELIDLLNLSSWCLVMVERLFLAMPQGCLQFVIVVFPDHTHLLFFTMLLILRLITTLSYSKMVRRICEITVALDFIFWLVHCSSEDVSFNSICMNM